MKRAIGLIALTVLIAGSLAASRRHKRSEPSTAQATFDYYMLVLSWAPDFCAEPGVPKDPRECGTGRKVGFVVHGMWPQGENSRGPEHCGTARPVAQSIVTAMLKYIPTESLIQHEWATHGTCSGLSASDYFGEVRSSRDALKVPAEFQAPSQDQHLTPAAVESKFASANPSYPAGAFRATCTGGALQEIRLCLTKDLKARQCGSSAGQCSTGTLLIRHVQ